MGRRLADRKGDGSSGSPGITRTECDESLRRLDSVVSSVAPQASKNCSSCCRAASSRQCAVGLEDGQQIVRRLGALALGVLMTARSKRAS